MRYYPTNEFRLCVGLCMHLLGARLLQCQAFHLMPPLEPPVSIRRPTDTWPPNGHPGAAMRRLLHWMHAHNATRVPIWRLPRRYVLPSH